MNTRPLSPFLVSVAFVLAGFASAPALCAQSAASAARATYTEARATVLADITRQVADHFRVEGELQLEPIRPIVVASDATGLTTEVIEFPSTLTSSVLVRVRLTASNQPAADQSVVLRAQLQREVWVARSALERDASLDISQLDTRRVDVLRERETVSTSEGGRDYQVIRPVPAGRLVTWRDIARRPLVKRGQVIEVAAVAGSLSITMKALAMENGAAGETVKVRNLDSKKEFNALVVADARAQVRF